jgi:outer membrane protein assembly factor BamB
LVFVTNFDRLFALHRATGRPIWNKEIYAIPSSATACDEERVMVGLSTGRLEAYYALDSKATQSNTAPGETAKSPPTPGSLFPQHRMGQIAWNWQANAKITARPLPAGKVVAFASQDGKVYVALSEIQTLLYRFTTGGPISASLGAHGVRTLLAPSEDHNLYAIDLFTANLKWTYATGAPVAQEPLVVGDDVYVINSAGSLSLVDANTGTPRWTISTNGGTLLSVGSKRIYLESSDGDLFVVDRASGQTLADPRATHQRIGLNLRDFTLGLTNHLNDRLYIATPAGLVICLRETGQVKPLLLRDPKLPPFGFIPDEGYPDALKQLGFPAGVANPTAPGGAAEPAAEQPK